MEVNSAIGFLKSETIKPNKAKLAITMKIPFLFITLMPPNFL